MVRVPLTVDTWRPCSVRWEVTGLLDLETADMAVITTRSLLKSSGQPPDRVAGFLIEVVGKKLSSVGHRYWFHTLEHCTQHTTAALVDGANTPRAA